MKIHPGRSSVTALITAALTMRMFTGMAVEFPYAMNAAWMCPLLGFVIFLPFVFAVKQVEKAGNDSVLDLLSMRIPKSIVIIAELAFYFLLVYDTAVNLRLIASSSNIIAMNDITVHILILPVALAAVISAILGMEAIGNSARIAMRLLPFFIIIILAIQIEGYKPGWLAPILGGGTDGIIAGGVYCAGCMALLSLPWLVSAPDRSRKGLLFCIFVPALLTAIVLLVYQMSFPTMISTNMTRAARIELILSNGRMSRSPQFVLDLLWYGGLLYLIAAEASTAAVFFKRILSSLRLWLTSLVTGILAGIAAVLSAFWLQRSANMMLYMYACIAAILVFLIIAFLIFRKGVKTCPKK